jgi:S-adenosylmethionine:tRNA ribosyltransferase-isomerase
VLPASDFDYELPPARIAQEPLQRRDASRLLHVAADGTLEDSRFADLPGLLEPGDLCVANETRVRRARVRGMREDGGRAELLVLQRLDDHVYSCLVRPARRLRVGSRVAVAGELTALIEARSADHEGGRIVRFSSQLADVEAAFERLGDAPLPPYIHRRLDDAERYQTMFASGEAASAAAPTAGLHFTPDVIARLRARGIGWVTLRLDIGLATFAPIRAREVESHVMHEERFDIPTATAAAIAEARRHGGRVVSVGTTTLRALETCAAADGLVTPGRGTTRLFVRPGYRFHVVDGLLTNFHQPRSSLLVLLAAFNGPDVWRRAYEHALAGGYRFLSFGDCMLCWRSP